MNAAEHELETAALRDRLSRLSEASLRINESLDLDTVLQEVVDSARALTDSAYGVITTLDDSGLPKDFVTSGLVPEAHQALENYLPEGLLVYRYLSALREPLRLDNYGEHIASLGLSDFLPISASSLRPLPSLPRRLRTTPERALTTSTRPGPPPAGAWRCPCAASPFWSRCTAWRPSCSPPDSCAGRRGKRPPATTLG